MDLEERQARILINKAGRNAGPEAKSYRVALPSTWMKALGVSENDREVTLQFDGQAVTIRRPAASGYAAFLNEARSQGHDLLILHFYDGNTLRTKIRADRTTRQLAIENEISDPLSTAFGVNLPPLGGFTSILGEPLYAPGAEWIAIPSGRAGAG